MTEYCFVFVTCESLPQAKKMAHAIVDNKLAGCVSLLNNVNSIYRWKGKIEESKEVLLLIKTHKSLFKQLENLVKEIHSYSTPEIVSVQFNEGSIDYLNWLKDSIQNI